MKKILITGILIITCYGLSAQLNSSNLNVPANAQPVPNATTTEKSATPQPQNVAPAPNPVPPIYPGGEVQAAETQSQLVYPPTTPNGTQPVQKEPLSPIESTNNLQPNRPQREEASRENPVLEVPSSTRQVNTIKKNPVIVSNNTNTTIKKVNTTNNAVKINSTVKTSKVETKSVSKKKLPKKTTDKN